MKRLVRKAGNKIKLLHGTTSTFVDSIFKDGLLPEGFTGNAMFNYNDYGRHGEPKHADCVYLTNDLENANRYSANAVKHNEGFPFVIEVEVDSDALTWDDDAFYKNYGSFDFGERDDQTGNWIRKPKKELWEQSLDINMQCAHYGKIESKNFTKIFLNGKWIPVKDFVKIVESYKNLYVKGDIINSDISIGLKDFNVLIPNAFKTRLTIIGRRIYLYDFSLEKELDKYQKQAVSIKLMEFLKNSIGEFGAKITYTPDFKKIGFNAKLSCFNYVFGLFEIKSNDSIIEELEAKIHLGNKDAEILKKIINCTATDEEFKLLYEYSIDFVGDLISYCENVLKYNKDEIITALKNIVNKYDDSYEQIGPEIEYLQIQKNKVIE